MVFRMIFGDLYLVMKALLYWHVHFHFISLFSGKIDKDHRSKIVLSKKDNIMNGTVLTAHAGGTIKIGSGVYIGRNSMIVSHSSIEIGSGTNIGMNVVILDHDHDYKKQTGGLLCSDVKIGKNVWIGASAIILRGTVIGDNSVVAAGSLIKGTYPANSLIMNKRDTTVTVISRPDEQ
jgi:acetyltransferase-like isoleucine patch superfamily enzyme